MVSPLENLLKEVEFRVGYWEGANFLPANDFPIRTYKQLEGSLPTHGVFIVEGGDLRNSTIKLDGILGKSGNLGRIYHINRGSLYFQLMNCGDVENINCIVEKRPEGITTDIYSLNKLYNFVKLNLGDVIKFCNAKGEGKYIQISGIYRYDEKGEVDLKRW